MAEFKPISSGDGKYFYKPTQGGLFLVEFVGIEDAPSTTNPKGETVERVAWNFKLFTIQGEPVIDNNFEDEDGNVVPQQAVVGRVTTTATGRKSNFEAFIKALLGRDVNREAGQEDDPADLIAEAVGQKAIANFVVDGTWNDGSPKAFLRSIDQYTE